MSSAEVADRDAEPLPQERPHRVLGEADEVVERHDRRAGRRERLRRGTAGSSSRSLTSARAPSSVTASKLHGCSRASAPGVKLRGSKGWSGWRTTTRSCAGPSGAAHGRVDDVEELADRDGGRPGDVRALVVARVGDDQAVRGRQQRVEQQLAVLGARIAVADVRVAEHEVVAVARRPCGGRRRRPSRAGRRPGAGPTASA